MSETWVVQKYGGTSIGKFPDQVTKIICDGLGESHVAVVCSARSTSIKADGTTNQLIRASTEAALGNTEKCKEVISLLHESHISAAKASLGDHGILAKVSSQISNITQDLLQIIDAAIVLREVSPRTLDIIISKGEILSCHLIVAVLHDRGVDARLVDLSNITPTEAPPDVNRAFYAAHVAALKPLLAEYKFCVPVITGFFGPVPGGLLGRVGRGYTDLCAALVAISLSASELQIYKEVDGICSADPRKVATAKLLPTITPAEATQLTFFGSEVLHPDTLEQIVSQNIPIRIKNTTKPVSAGTLVVPRPILETCDPKEMTDSPMLSKNKTKTWGSEHLKYPTAITSKDQILIINVQSNKRIGLAGYLAGIFTILARWHLFCDMVSVTETNVSLAFHCHHKYLRGKDEELEIVDAGLKGAVDELSELGKVTFFDNMAIVSLVGEDLKNMVGITGKMTGVLGEHNINIRMIAQDFNEINISLVVKGQDADRALNLLHTNLFTFAE